MCLCQITLVNMLGETTVIDQMVCEEYNKKINVRHLKPGVYTVKVQNKGVIVTGKLIISR